MKFSRRENNFGTMLHFDRKGMTMLQNASIASYTAEIIWKDILQTECFYKLR